MRGFAVFLEVLEGKLEGLVHALVGARVDVVLAARLLTISAGFEGDLQGRLMVDRLYMPTGGLFIAQTNILYLRPFQLPIQATSCIVSLKTRPIKEIEKMVFLLILYRQSKSTGRQLLAQGAVKMLPSEVLPC